MQKYHKVLAFVIGLCYAVLLFMFSGQQPVFRFLLPAFLVFCLAAFYYNKSYLNSINKYNAWVLVRSTLLFFSGCGIFLLLPNGFFKQLFLLSAFFVISFFELAIGNFSENLLVDETLIVAFGLFLSFTAAEQYFPDFKEIALFIGKWHLLSWQFSLQPFYLIGVFFSAMLLTRAFYEFIPQPPRTKWIASLVLALFACEFFWALTFLPLHYSAKTVVLICLFYFCLIMNYYHLFHSLSLKKIQFHLILITIACGIALLSTPWQVLN